MVGENESMGWKKSPQNGIKYDSPETVFCRSSPPNIFKSFCQVGFAVRGKASVWFGSMH